MDFPLIPSGTLFSSLTPAGRAEYFAALSQVGADAIDLRAVYGRKGWMRRLSAEPDPALADEAERLRWNGMSPQERYDYAYGNALNRTIMAMNAPGLMKSAAEDAKRGFDALSGGVPGNEQNAMMGQDDPVSANEAVFKEMFGG